MRLEILKENKGKQPITKKILPNYKQPCNAQNCHNCIVVYVCARK